jgi:hypothetical protein
MLNYLNLTDLLAAMGFLSCKTKNGEEASSVELQERELLFDFWTVLEGESRAGVHRSNILSFLFGIQGLLRDQ